MNTASTLARGMTAQLRRVNESPAEMVSLPNQRLQERINDLERQVERRDQIIRDLRAQLAAYQESPLEKSDSEGFKTITHAGRPAATAVQIALLHNVNVSNVYRQLQRHKLAGAFVNGHWIVYTDQDIRFKSYRRRA